MRFIGIDVGAKELFVQVIRNEKLGKVIIFQNTHQGHKKLINYINPQKHEAKVCLEATGVYHFDLAVALSKVQNLEVMVLNPKAAKNFASALMTREKSDIQDATVLAKYAQRMDFVVWEPPEEDRLKLRAFARRIDAIIHLKAKTKNQLHALEQTEFVPSSILKSQKKQIRFFEKEVLLLEKEAIKLIEGNTLLENQFEKILTTKGFGKASAIQLLGEIATMPEGLSNKQWVAMAGLDPRKHQSGTSLNKKSFISKAGNRRLRKALFMPALSAKEHEPHIRAYFNYLVEVRGLKKMQAVCAVMRKLLHAIHAMLEKNEHFDGTRFFDKFEQYQHLNIKN